MRAAAVVLLGVTALTGASATRAVAHPTAVARVSAGSYDNALIATTARKYVGQWGGNACADAHRSGETASETFYPTYPDGMSATNPPKAGVKINPANGGDGQCRSFVNCIVWMASGKTQWLGLSPNDYFYAFTHPSGGGPPGVAITSVADLKEGDIVQQGQTANSPNLHTFIIVKPLGGSSFDVVDSNSKLDEFVQDRHAVPVTLSPSVEAFRMGTSMPSDMQPPTQPGSPKVSNLSSSPSATLSWSPSKDNVAVKGYALFLNNKQITTVNGTSYTFSGLTCGATYTFGVEAYDAAGNFSGMATASATLSDCLRAKTAGKVVTVASNGTSYYEDGTVLHGLHWIPDANTYYCVLDSGKSVYTVSTQSIANTLGNGQPWQPECLSVQRVVGHIVREAGGTAYTVTDDGTWHGSWHWIPDGPTYNCLIKTMSKIDANWAEIYSLRGGGSTGQYEGAHATCSAPSGPVFTVMNTNNPPPDGVYFRNSPHWNDTSRITGLGVYMNEQVQLQCYGFGDAVGPYGVTLWYYVKNVSRPTVNGQSDVGWLSTHFINDGKTGNQIDAGVPAC